MKKIFSKVIIAAVAAAAFATCTSFVSHADEGVILDGIYAGDIPLGSRTKEEAEADIEAYVQSLMDKSITLYAVDGAEASVTPREMDFKWSNRNIVEEAYDIGRTGNVVNRYKLKKDLKSSNMAFPLEFTVDDELVKNLLRERCSIYDVAAVDGSLALDDNGTFIVKGGTTGKALDIESSVSKLEHFVCSEWNGRDTSVELAVVETTPRGSNEEFGLVKDVLGTYNTSFSTSSAARSSNIRNGASLINGSIVFPGEEFSFYDHIKPFTFDNGYQIAAAYSSGQVVDSIGGGICQVSSTLYNSVLLSELTVTERRNHGMIVTYVDPARDATIAESAGTDFRFVNSTDAPIYIDAYTTSEKRLYITIYGHETRPEDRKLSYESEVVSKTVPEDVVIKQDAGQPVGYVSTQSAHVGYKANLWKIVTENGETTKELVNTSTYNPAPKYVTVGVATSDPSVQAIMANALATGDVDTVKAAAASCKAMTDAGADSAAIAAAYASQQAALADGVENAQPEEVPAG